MERQSKETKHRKVRLTPPQTQFICSAPISLYVHVPFCKAKCNYCNFYSLPSDPSHKKNPFLSGYFDLIKTELGTAVKNYYKNEKIKVRSIYFGGGTPSVMPAKFFEDSIGLIIRHFDIINDPEITIEVNPESARFEELKALRNMGINRISIGAQSFNNLVLKSAGRLHNKRDIFRSFEDARKAGFENISIDIILGLPGQSVPSLKKEIKNLLDLSPEHISAYMLNIEKGSKFYKSGQMLLPEEEIAYFYELFCWKIVLSGYNHYEISNFAKPGFESRHNLNYWKRGEYIGLGPSASSFIRLKGPRGLIKELRKTNEPDLKKYSRNLKKPDGFKEISVSEILSKKDIINEEIFLSLRTSEGMPIEKITKFTDPEIINSAINEGLMERKDDNLILTMRGMLLSSELFARIML